MLQCFFSLIILFYSFLPCHASVEEAVKFCLPNDYQCLKNDDANGSFILAPKDFSLQSLESLKSIEKPMIIGIKMQFPMPFSEFMNHLIAAQKIDKSIQFDAEFLKWGNYPVASIKAMVAGNFGYLAYVGLEDEEQNGFLFSFVYPDAEKGQKPSKESLLFWENFITKTKAK